MAARAKNTLYVTGIDASVTESHLNDAFISFGNVKEVVRSENQNKDYALITFEDEEDALQAMDNLNGAVILGKVMFVSIAQKQRSGARTGAAFWTSEQYLNDRLVASSKEDDDDDS